MHACGCSVDLTGQEVVLSIQKFLNVSDPLLLDVNVSGLQRESLG